MKKMHILLFVLLSTFVLLISACKLPQPGAPATSVPQGTTLAETPAAIPTTQAAGSKPAGEQPTATQPPAVTATPQATTVPPTATPLPPTATLAPATPSVAAERLQFTAGSTSLAIRGELEVGSVKYYVLTANGGQTMVIDVWSPNKDVHVGVQGVSDKQVFLDVSSKVTTWSGVLPATQDYLITLVSAFGRTSYELDVTIPASPAGPTATSAPAGTAFDPYATYGQPANIDYMNSTSYSFWVLPETNRLPDTENVRINIQDNQVFVTGKKLGFSTWWFSWPSLNDFFIELTVDTENCAGADAYGLILRGPQHLAGVSYGYVVAFTCDGKIWVYRLDGVNPWSSTDLVSPTASSAIITGSNRQNVIGVQAVGDTLTVYANGIQVAQVKDARYLEGRYGLFVRADATYYYTFHPTRLAYWELKK